MMPNNSTTTTNNNNAAASSKHQHHHHQTTPLAETTDATAAASAMRMSAEEEDEEVDIETPFIMELEVGDDDDALRRRTARASRLRDANDERRGAPGGGDDEGEELLPTAKHRRGDDDDEKSRREKEFAGVGGIAITKTTMTPPSEHHRETSTTANITESFGETTTLLDNVDSPLPNQQQSATTPTGAFSLAQPLQRRGNGGGGRNSTTGDMLLDADAASATVAGAGGGGAVVTTAAGAGTNNSSRLSMLVSSGAIASGFQSKAGSLKVEDYILRLNIGGSSYRIRTRTILKHGADTLLGRFVRMNDHHRRTWADAYFEDSNEFFFERVPRYFDPIYDYYATGKLHVPKDLCFDKFMAELRFWAVSKAKMDECCSPFAQYCLMKKVPADGQPEKDHFIGLRCAKIRRRLWLILEGHTNSRWWRLFELTSTSFVVLSITALILSSMPDFQVPESRTPQAIAPGPTYPTHKNYQGFTVSSNVVIKEGDEPRPEMVEHPVFNYVENICVIYFTLEYLLRFWVAPQKAQFVREFLNVIDVLAIAPFVFEMVLILVGFRGDNIRKVRWALLTVRLLRVLRVVRIAKLGRFSPGLANFALTLQKSKRQMQMVAIVLLTVIIFFSTLIYFLERDEPDTTFVSIPAAFWWCLFSQTKWVPQTAAGKMVGGAGITCGVLVLALPIAILVNNFMTVVKIREESYLKRYAERHAVHGDHV